MPGTLQVTTVTIDDQVKKERGEIGHVRLRGVARNKPGIIPDRIPSAHRARDLVALKLNNLIDG
jgi:hypothetical protein